MIYEYQKDRDHQKPLEFYRDYKGILVTDGLQQYHLVDKKLPDVTNANCWAHARRDFADVGKGEWIKRNPSCWAQFGRIYSTAENRGILYCRYRAEKALI